MGRGAILCEEKRGYSLLKDRGASPLPLRPAPVPAPVYAALLRWMGGFSGSCNEKRSRRFLAGARHTVFTFREGM